MRPYMLLKVKEEKLPSGRQVETFRWDFAGIISFMFLTFLGHFFFGLLSFAILKLFGPVYEFYSAWIIENPKHLLLLKKRVRQYTMETNLNLNKLDSHEEKEWTQIL